MLRPIHRWPVWRVCQFARPSVMPSNLQRGTKGVLAGIPARTAALALCLLLAACSSGGQTPAPPVQPNPGIQAFALDLTQPTLGLGLSINGDVPPVVDLPEQYTFGTFKGPAVEGQNCADPSPCYTIENGVLRIRSPGGGWPIITRQTFSGSQSHRLVASGECLAITCWGGLVIYNGDALQPVPDDQQAAFERMWETGQWMGLYFSWAEGGVQLGVWSPSQAHLIPGMVFPAGQVVDLEITYNAGRWGFAVNRVPVAIEQTADFPTLGNNPHAALFMGDLNMNVSAWEVWVK